LDILIDLIWVLSADDLQADSAHFGADQPIVCCMLDSMLAMLQHVSQGLAPSSAS